MHWLFRAHARSRSEDDRREIARRVAIYRRQVERTGRIRWLPNVMKPKVLKSKGKEVCHEAPATETH